MPTQETPTPGQLCYAAYTAALSLTFPHPWDDVSPQMQHAWEAAAQAVLDAGQAPPRCPRCGQAGPVTLAPPLFYDARVCLPCAAELQQLADDDEHGRGQEARYA